MRPALTLIETLLALVILSTLVMAALGWMQAATTASVTAGSTLREENAAQATLRLIHDDLRTGDFELTDDRRDSRSAPPRVRIVDHELSIDTRSGGGPATAVYRLDRETLQLVRTADVPRLVLTGVNEFACHIDELEETLTVTIECSGTIATRRFKL